MTVDHVGLSVPALTDTFRDADRVLVSFLTVDGEPREVEISGAENVASLLAAVRQRKNPDPGIDCFCLGDVLFIFRKSAEAVGTGRLKHRVKFFWEMPDPSRPGISRTVGVRMADGSVAELMASLRSLGIEPRLMARVDEGQQAGGAPATTR